MGRPKRAFGGRVTTAEARRRAAAGWAEPEEETPPRRAFRYALTGAAAALLAIPLGLLVGRKLRRADP